MSVDLNSPRWVLFRSSGNPIRYFSVLRRGPNLADDDYFEFSSVLKSEFGAVEVDRLDGPYSSIIDFAVEGIRVRVLLDDPDSIDVFASKRDDNLALERLVNRLLVALNV